MENSTINYCELAVKSHVNSFWKRELEKKSIISIDLFIVAIKRSPTISGLATSHDLETHASTLSLCCSSEPIVIVTRSRVEVLPGPGIVYNHFRFQANAILYFGDCYPGVREKNEERKRC